MAVLGLRFCARAFSSCGKRGPLFIAVRGPLIIAASLVAEHRLQTRRLSNCGSRAQLLRGMWDIPRPGLEPVSPALAGRFSTTAPPGKPCLLLKTVTQQGGTSQPSSFNLADSTWVCPGLADTHFHSMNVYLNIYYILVITDVCELKKDTDSALKELIVYSWWDRQ